MPRTRERLNIVLICADQMRADALGCAGNRWIRTPNLDALAERGVRFARAYCSAPVCIPTRISMFSGLYPHNTGKVAHVRAETDPRLEMMPQLFGAAGYRTAIVGKTHFWPADETYGSEYARLTIDRHLSHELGAKDAYLAYLHEMGLEGVEDESRLPLNHYRTCWTAREARRFIANGDDRPFFLFCSFVKPHPPYDPPAPYDSMYTDVMLPGPAAHESELTTKPRSVRLRMDPGGIDDRINWMESARRYYGLISLVDRAVGDIVSELHEHRQDERTLVLFTSDHGELLGDHFINGKELFYDASASVPMIFCGPGVSRGVVSTVLAGHVDILPTLLDAAGIDVPRRCDGLPLAGVLADPRYKIDRKVLFAELHRGTRTEAGVRWIGDVMAVDRRYKYIYHSNAWESEDWEQELYDLSVDRKELSNVADAHPGICRRMRDAVLKWMVGSLANTIRPVDERYPLARYDTGTRRIEYRGGAV